ncbi:hypothetical protein M0R19_04345 [Candidatus Pacearchaeota archaeon]|nr:hypothetical protein [Candidatus Pacearchaeota archaeon]
MATTFKSFVNDDIAKSTTLLHESIPVTGTLVSGTYTDSVKTYSHGMFKTVFDYPYLSSSANNLFDLTVGHSVNSIYVNTADTFNTKKTNIYNEYAQLLAGYDSDGDICEFEASGNFTDPSSALLMRDFYALNFSRLLYKDEIKKGTVSVILGVRDDHDDPFFSGTSDLAYITDKNGYTNYRTNSPAGEFGLLYVTGSKYSTDTDRECGFVFYQAGVVLLTSSIFMNVAGDGFIDTGYCPCSMSADTTDSVLGYFTTRSIESNCDAFLHRVYNISFNNTTELNSTIYFCRLRSNEFNYSSNPTYISGSKMVVKNISRDAPVSYITTVGLYSAQNELLAVAKLSEPLKKDPTTELNLRVRLDY